MSLGIASNVISYTDGEEALYYLTKNLNNKNLLPDYIFLDINMPIMDGWEFLDKFKHLLPFIEKKIYVYSISSTVDENELAKLRQHEIITDIIKLPITRESVSNLFQIEKI